MEIRLTLRPGAAGTKKLLARYGERLVCVRYRYDKATGRRVKTAELIVQDVAWAGRARKPRRNDHDLVGVRVGWNETELRAAVKRAGGIWRPRQRLWEVSWEAVRTLGLHVGSSKNLLGQSETRIYSGIWCHIPVDVCIYRYMVLRWHE